MVALLAIWLRSLTMVASVNLATAKKDGCAKNKPNTDHTWESIGDTDHTWKSIGDKDRQSVNLATTKKMVLRPPMVALLAIWLHPLAWLPSKKRLRDLLWLRFWQYGCVRELWLRPLTWLPPKKMVALKTDQIQITRGNQ
jgi:hypothetical protein